MIISKKDSLHDFISLCKLIWRHWTYKMPVRYILSSVRVRLSIFSPLSIVQHMGLCVFSLPISLVMVERIYTLSYYHHQIGSMNYYPLFMVTLLNNGMRCMSLSILMVSSSQWISSRYFKAFNNYRSDMAYISNGNLFNGTLHHQTKFKIDMWHS